MLKQVFPRVKQTNTSAFSHFADSIASFEFSFEHSIITIKIRLVAARGHDSRNLNVEMKATTLLL